MAHSKRNTSLPHFTSYERSLLHTTWGTQKTRLSRESFLPFASCHLCLLPAQEPVVACATNGDIFCRECAVNNLLAQHQEIKRLEKARLLAEEERRDGVERSIADARARELRDFEMTSMGLDVRKRKSAAAVPTDSAPANETAEGTAKKRRRDFKLDGDEVKRASEQELDKARREAEEERSKSSESQLHSFWVPALTPSANAPEGPRRKLSPICPASTEDQSHPYSLKTLVAVHFTTEIDEKTGETRRICPSCRKGLTNGSKAILTKPCGHVLCKLCVDEFMKLQTDASSPRSSTTLKTPARTICYVCETDVTEPPTAHGSKSKQKIRPGCIRLSCEGTGFAAGGNNIAKKRGTAFQC